MSVPKTLDRKIRTWIAKNTDTIKQEFRDGGDIWVAKYFPPEYLEGFYDPKQANKQLYISTSAGFTWGDGVYVAPFLNHVSAMIYGRVGVIGRIDPTKLNMIYEARYPYGLQLYQEWITYQISYMKLTLTAHADVANQELRNKFRRDYDIDMVVFLPDQLKQHRPSPDATWFAVTDWSKSYSSMIEGCEWAVIVSEELLANRTKELFRETMESLIGPHGVVECVLTPQPPLSVYDIGVINQTIMDCYHHNAGGSGRKIALIKPL